MRHRRNPVSERRRKVARSSPASGDVHIVVVPWAVASHYVADVAALPGTSVFARHGVTVSHG